VNRRVAAHMIRKTPLGTEPAVVQDNRQSSGSRAAQAAARVAARYAKAPSYSEMLANEARAAILAAEAASRAAQEAQAKAQSVLDSLQAAAVVESAPVVIEDRAEPGPAIVEQEVFVEPPVFLQPEARSLNTHQVNTHPVELAENQSYAIRWEPELPVRQPEAAAVRGWITERADSGIPDWPEAEPLAAEALEVVEPAQPIFANLIEFPRELVATRKVRPRLAEGPIAAEELGSQLSIFEVDPSTISVEPEVERAAMEASAPAWNGPRWSGMRLDAQPQEEPAEMLPEIRKTLAIEQASASRRLLAAVMDAALVAGAVLGAAIPVITKVAEVPGVRAMEIGSALALLLAGGLYLMLFLTFAGATPGMRYARICLCTFEGRPPVRSQRWARLAAILLSVLPVGVGIVWSIFDEDHLTWHDRLSQTYLRNY
jgi:uncharacterized RDD family membrane protein YckC